MRKDVQSMTVFDGISLFGGLALFLYGMSLMSEKLEKLAGGRLEKIFEKLTSNRFKGLLLGAFVTAVIQSSSATTVMLVGFVNSGIMRLSQAISIIMGANIGTTITSWLLSLSGLEGDSLIVQLFKPSTFTPVLALIGIIMQMVFKNNSKKDIGGILLGFAILMTGMDTMSGSVSGLKDSSEFGSILTMFSNPVMGVLAGAVLTAIIQSSSASVGILQALSSTGQMTFGSALPIIMGQNIGTCVTAIISSIGANKNAKRVAAVHLSFNVIGTVVFLIAYYLIDSIVHFSFTDGPVSEFSIAVVHTIFNLITTIILLPFTSVLEKLAYFFVKSDVNADGTSTDAPVILDERFLSTPGVAIEQCRNVANRMAELAKTTIKLSLDIHKEYNEETAQTIIVNEGVIDKYEDIIGSYLMKLSGKSLSSEDSRSVSCLLHAIGDYERISDHAVNILDTAKEINEKNIQFSESAKQELSVMFRAIKDITELTVKAFEGYDVALARKVEPLEEVVDNLRTDMKARHIERLRNNQCTIEHGFVFTDLLTDLERVSDHCSNIAVNLIQISGNSFENHEYLHTLKKDSNKEFFEQYDEYAKEYLLP